MLGFLFGRKKETAEASGPPELLAIEKQLPVPPDRAFEIFVDKLGSWWPREYTWAKDNLEEIGIEPKLDGTCFERRNDGTASIWGTVLTIARPEQIVFTWQIGPDRSAIDNPAAASRVDIRFSAKEDGTSFVLVHRDFPRHGPGWQKYRASLAGRSGWPFILDRYMHAVLQAK